MDTRQTLQALEERLLSREVRQNAQEVASLLADEFREFASSGEIFSKSEIIDLLQSGPPASFSLNSFEVFPLAEQTVLVTYRAVKEVMGSLPTKSLRSSIWILRDGRRQMVFHQGTRIPQ